ncbi:hypothetical protein D3C80_903130 [compost metagenome]
MTGVRINGRRLSRSHPAHIMASMRVRRSHRAHGVTGMRIDRGRLGAVSSVAAHVVARMGIDSGRLGRSLLHTVHVVTCTAAHVVTGVSAFLTRAFGAGAGPGRRLVRRRHRRGRAHVVTRVRISGGRLGRSLHPAHVVAGVRVGSGLSAMSGVTAHVMARMRVRRRRGGRHGRPGPRRGPWAGLLRASLRRAGRRGVGAVPAMRLGDGGTGGQHQRQNRDSGEQGAAHRAAPSSGRTVTTLNIPACMCISRWQWKAQSPGASAVRSKVTLEPGATLTVCFSG